MKRKSHQAIVLLTISLLFVGCSKSATEHPKEMIEAVEIESLEQVYGCTNTNTLLSYQTRTAAGVPKMYTIKNQTDFDRLVKGVSCSPTIDFGRHMLLIGVETLNSGYNSISYDLKKISEAGSDTLLLTINFRLNGATVISEVTWHVFIPKALEHIPVKINKTKQ